MAEKDKTLDTLIAGGFIGAALGALLSKDKDEGAIIGALLGAAFAATHNANEEAKKTKLPLKFTENGKLYELLPSGEKRFIKNVTPLRQVSSKKYRLK